MTLISMTATLFDEVARFGSIRKAAERLNISPSALNRRILNLEAEYGVLLFERLPRGMRLTAAGELLLADVRRWRFDQERSKVRLQEMQGLRCGHVAIGLMECLADSFAFDFFKLVQKQYPGLTLELFVGGTTQNVDLLVDGRLDIAICFNVPSRPEINKLLSFDVMEGIVVAHGHPLAGKSSVHLSDCLAYPFILPDFSLATRNLIDRAISAIAAQPVPSAVTNSTRLMKRLIADGFHLTFLGMVDLFDELGEGSLQFVPLAKGQLPREELSLIVRNTHCEAPTVLAVSNLLQDILLALPVFSTSSR